MEMLDTFDLKIGLPVNKLSDIEECKNYLNMDISQLEKLDSKDCANISFKLSQLSLYIQRTVNREKAISRTLKNRINKIVAPKISQYYSYAGWELQKAAAVADNDVTLKLNEELIESEAKQDNLENISLGIKDLANHMKNLQFAKRENNG